MLRLTRRRTHSKKSNGHKMTCVCPICKNMKKSKSRGKTKRAGRRSRRSSRRQ